MIFQAGPKAEVIKSKMTHSMETHALTVVRQIFNRYKSQYDVAKRITEAMEEEYGGSWSCIVGPGTYSNILHYEDNCYIIFKLEDIKIVLAKSKS